MPDETTIKDTVEGGSNADTPQDILPLFFTSKTQQIFECRADEDVNSDNPYKRIQKAAILQDFKDRAAVSDFHPAKAIVLDYPGEELLVVYDADFKYGQNFYLCATEECKERILHPEAAATPLSLDEKQDETAAEDEIVVRKVPSTPKPWISLGSETEVIAEKVIENRTKLKLRISRKRCEFGAPVQFVDENATSVKDAAVECLSYDDETYSLKRCELDVGIQAVQELEEKGIQSDWKKPRNACVQYEARFLPEEKKADAEESPSLLEFIRKVTPRFELALQQNEIMDVFFDDYLSLADEDSTFGSKSDNYLKEYQSFTDLLYSKEKIITNAEWHPTAKGIIAVSCAERMSFDERVDNASRIIMTPSLILIWSFSDPIHPQLLLEAPDDIFSFKFNPSEPTIIAGGCVNGQVVLWDISDWGDRLHSHRQAEKTKKNTMTSLGEVTEGNSTCGGFDGSRVYKTYCFPEVPPGFEDDSNTDHTPVVRYCAVSAIENSHKSCVSDLQWIPDHMEIGRMGVVVENRSSYCHQLITCAADGTILFWDTRPTKSAHHSQLAPGNKPTAATTPLKQLDLTWKPISKVSVSHVTGSGEFGPTKFSLAEKQGDRTSMKQPDNDKEARSLNRAMSMTGKKDQGKVLDNIPTKLFVGTESGDVIYMDWKLSKDSDSGKITASKPELVLPAHEGLVCVLQRSPFFKDILLSVGGWTVAVWKEGISTGPLLESATFTTRLTAGCWSPTRPGVFYVTRSDGNVDVWDLLDKSHEPSLTQNVTSASITSFCPYQVSSKQQLLSIGDNVGTLHIMEVPWNLRRPSVNEKNIMENFFDREVSRLKFAEERRKIRAMENKNKGDDSEKRKQQEVKKPDEIEAEWEAKARMLVGGAYSLFMRCYYDNHGPLSASGIEYQEYLEMEKRFLEDLGIKEASSDM